MSDAYPLLESLLAEAGFTLTDVADRDGILGEDEARVVWAHVYPSATQLLNEWQDEQAWFVDFAADKVSVEKSWELYLVLGSDLPATPGDVALLEMIRGDTSYARKLIVTGLASTTTPARVRDALAPLRPLTWESAGVAPDPISVLEDQAKNEGRDDVSVVLERYRANLPLFEVHE